ncbi:hypothetical protein AB0M29_31130 [Streptomyces sp. NPDC051976]|uniref:effector-associated constant component EACC1 n=1 Tax=Streptomyces sp. NPDC051976 TaxID=3154947 RepID=UPI00341F0052
MQLTLGVSGTAAEEEARSLSEWLRADRAILRSARIELSAAHPPEQGAQGSAVDIVSLVLGSGFSAASLAVAVVQWRLTRPNRPSVTVQRPDGVKVTISDASPEEVRQLVQHLLDQQP